jgi:hypothetical protein
MARMERRLAGDGPDSGFGPNRTSNQIGPFFAKRTGLGSCMEPMARTNYLRLVSAMPQSASAAPAAW